jgi:ribosomal protein L11 methylase PrmA
VATNSYMRSLTTKHKSSCDVFNILLDKLVEIYSVDYKDVEKFMHSETKHANTSEEEPIFEQDKVKHLFSLESMLKSITEIVSAYPQSYSLLIKYKPHGQHKLKGGSNMFSFMVKYIFPAGFIG